MRRGQILSLDALLSLVIVVMVIGVVINTNDMIKAEITDLVEWHDRANIANNMLDILTKSPGYPEDWETTPSNVKIVGLRSNNVQYSIDYRKLRALINQVYNNNSVVISSLVNMSMKKDFMLGIYLSKVNLTGNIDFTPPQVGSSVDVSSNAHLSITPQPGYAYGKPILASWISPERIDGRGTGNIQYLIKLTAGETFVFKLAEEVQVRIDTPGPGGPINYIIPNGSIVHIRVESGYLIIGWSNTSGLYKLWIPYHRQGQSIWTEWEGTIWWGVQGGEIVATNISINYVYATEVKEADYNITLINGTLITNPDVIQRSMNNSMWIQYSEKRVPIAKIVYNSTYILSPSDLPKELYVGTLINPVPEYMSIRVSFNQVGYLLFYVLFEGTQTSGYSIVAVYKTSSTSPLEVIVNKTINGKSTIITYSSDNLEYISIPWVYLLPKITPEENLNIYVWACGMENINQATITDTGGINTLLHPQITLTILKLWVWDDR